LQKHYFDWDARVARNDGGKVGKAKVVDVGRTLCSTRSAAFCARAVFACATKWRASRTWLGFSRGSPASHHRARRRLDNPYSLNTVDVCPVGALTAKDFRFSMRAWELWATPSVCPGCATGCNIEIHAAATWSDV